MDALEHGVGDAVPLRRLRVPHVVDEEQISVGAETVISDMSNGGLRLETSAGVPSVDVWRSEVDRANRATGSESIADVVQLIRLDNGGDELHFGRPPAVTATVHDRRNQSALSRPTAGGRGSQDSSTP